MGNGLAIILHLLAINIWIGGTFFSVIVLPRAISQQERVVQHKILLRAFGVFFLIVWLAILMLLGSGTWMVINIFGGLSVVPVYVLLMVCIAISMITVFAWIYFMPYRQYRKKELDLSMQDHYLNRIRLLSKINMILGICIVVVIGGGPYFLR